LMLEVLASRAISIVPFLSILFKGLQAMIVVDGVETALPTNLGAYMNDCYR
jgi:hypothetical protein